MHHGISMARGIQQETGQRNGGNTRLSRIQGGNTHLNRTQSGNTRLNRTQGGNTHLNRTQKREYPPKQDNAKTQ